MAKTDEVIDSPALSGADLQVMMDAMRRHYNEGDPVKGGVLQGHITSRTAPPPDLLYFGDVKPRGGKIASLELEIPPWVGKGSGNDVWRSFAKQVCDTPEEVIDRMERNDIQRLLVSLKVIPAKELAE